MSTLALSSLIVHSRYFSPSAESNKKLSYRRGTARRAVLVSAYYVSRGVGVRKVSISKSDHH